MKHCKNIDLEHLVKMNNSVPSTQSNRFFFIHIFLFKCPTKVYILEKSIVKLSTRLLKLYYIYSFA